jgi:hypothetical protein
LTTTVVAFNGRAGTERSSESTRGIESWRFRNGRGGNQDKDRCDIRLEGDYDPASIGDREADVDRRDQCQAEGVDGGRIEPPQGERGRCLESSEDEPPHDSRSYLPSPFLRVETPADGGMSHGSTSKPSIMPLS